MNRPRKNPGAEAKFKKKMTREQMQLAIIKKKECDAKALRIVEQLLEPEIDPLWLVENLQNINKCHMEDVIEERAIIKLCGYVLCKNPLTLVINQRYHISLKNKKVYDVTKRKNFCSSSCFGASNYLLEQMLTSPLWLRDKEEIPKFRIFTPNKLSSNVTPGEEVDITIIEPCKSDEVESEQKIMGSSKEDIQDENESNEDSKSEASLKEGFVNVNNKCHLKSEEYKSEKDLKKETSELIQNFVNETVKNLTSNTMQTVEESIEISSFTETKNINLSSDTTVEVLIDDKKNIKSQQADSKLNKSECDQGELIEQCVCNVNLTSVELNINQQNENNSENRNITPVNYATPIQNDKIEDAETQSKDTMHDSNNKKIDSDVQTTVPQKECKTEKLRKSKTKTKKRTEKPLCVDVNLASRVEESFQQWITEETVHFLFGDDTVKQKTIEKIEQQDKYSILCEKLNRLQFLDELEDSEVLEKPELKPAPHFAVLKEQGQKLDVKVRAFYEGKTTFEDPIINSVTDSETTDSKTFVPLTDAHAPQAQRRKIFLDRLDQVLPDLIRTLTGNNEVYARVCTNYTSVRCTAVKALVHTFSLSAKNIIFKTAEWTLVGLVIIKMLSLLDPWLADLLVSKQANLYISMILTSYKLDPHYLNLLVASFNPNINPR